MGPELIDFVLRKTHLKAEEIKPELRLAEDIGFYGLDAASFIEDFFTEFKIRNIDKFDFDVHIDGGPDFVPRLLNWIKNLLIKSRRKYLRPDVSLGHLDKVLERGEWFNER